MQYQLDRFKNALHEQIDYSYAIAQLNVSRARLALAIDKWDVDIQVNGPSEISCKFLDDSKLKYRQIEDAIKRLLERNFDILEKCGVCPFCRIPLEECGSDHK